MSHLLCSQDTRTHVVGELYDTERSYVESLQILVEKYMKPLKSLESNRVLIDSVLVDEIFYSIPEILQHHESFLGALQNRLSSDWDSSQVIGNVFIEAFTNQQIIDDYTAFINNWKNARQAIKVASQAKPAFERFLEAMSREHRNKLTLDALLIMPVQRIPRYELLIKELIKHTPEDHPDHRPLMEAQKKIHELALKIDRAEKEMIHQEQLRDLEQLIDGHVELQHHQRDFLRYDLVTIVSASALTVTKKERVLFLFCDLLIMTSIKKKASRRSNLQNAFANSTNDLSLLEGNKFKLLLRVPLDQIDIRYDHQLQQQQHQHHVDQQRNKLIIQQQQHHHHEQQQKRLEADLQILLQIESLAGQFSPIQHQHRHKLDQVIQDLFADIRQTLATSTSNVTNPHQTLSEMQIQEQAANFSEEQHLDSPAYLTPSPIVQTSSSPSHHHHHHQQQQPANQSSSQSNHSHQDSSTTCSLEFLINNNSSSSNGASGSGNDFLTIDHQGSYSTGSDSPAMQQLSGSGPGGDTRSQLQSSSAAAAESLVVTFSTIERRQAFIQAFLEAKQQRYQQQQQKQHWQQQQQQHGKIFSSSVTLKLAGPAATTPIEKSSRSAEPFLPPPAAARLHHQESADASYLARPSSATYPSSKVVAQVQEFQKHHHHHHQACGNNHSAAATTAIAHQMSAPQSLSSVEEGGIKEQPGGQCISCSFNLVAETEKAQLRHQHHHHHQLMHQPASQPASLNTICCREPHNHHRHSADGDQEQQQQLDAALNSVVNLSHEGGNQICSCQTPGSDLSLHVETPTSKSARELEDARRTNNNNSQGSMMNFNLLLAKCAPKFLVTLPVDFLSTQHPALQFTCSALPSMSPSRATIASSNNSRRSQTVEDNLGQLWLCMSNGYVSHVALVKIKKRHYAPRSDPHSQGATGGCYSITPMVISAGDICKSRINCAAQVKWLKAASTTVSRNEESAREPASQGAKTVAAEDKSPPIDIECKAQVGRREQLVSRSAPCKSAAASLKSSEDERDVDDDEDEERGSKASGHHHHRRTAAAKRSLDSKNSSSLSASRLLLEVPPGAVAVPSAALATRTSAKSSTATTNGTRTTGKGANHFEGGRRRSIHDELCHGHQQQPQQGKHLNNRSSPALVCSLHHLPQNHNNRNHHLSYHHHSHHHHHHHHHQHSNKNNHHQHSNHHHHHRGHIHSHHHHHTHSHAPQHLNLQHSGQQHQHQHLQRLAYVSRHNTVPIAELRRGLSERQDTLVATHRSGQFLSPQASTTQQPVLSSSVSLSPRSSSPAPSKHQNSTKRLNHHSLDLDVTNTGGDETARQRSVSPKASGGEPATPATKSRPTTPISFGAAASVSKGFRSARLMRHQASLKTSSILARLVGGATRRSMQMRRSTNQSSSGEGVASRNADKTTTSSDLDDNDTDAEIVTAIGSPKGDPTSAASHRSQVVSPLSSASSLNSSRSDSSSFTVNSVCASSPNRSSCELLAHSYSTATCCMTRGNSPTLPQLQPQSTQTGSSSRGQPCGHRGRSATAPSRPLCDFIVGGDFSTHHQSYVVPAKPEVANYKVSSIDDDDDNHGGEKLPNTETMRRSSAHHRDSSSARLSAASSYGSREQTNSSLWLGCDDGSLIIIDCLNSNNTDNNCQEDDQNNSAQEQQTANTFTCGNVHSEIKMSAPISAVANLRDELVFVALSNGQLAVFSRNSSSGAEDIATWSLTSPQLITVTENELHSTAKLLLVDRDDANEQPQLWYSYGRNIFVFNININADESSAAAIKLETTIMAPTNDLSALRLTVVQSVNSIDNMELVKSLSGVWVSFKNSHLVHFYDTQSYKLLFEVNLYEPINRLLCYGNEIIRQHKTACLKATSLLNHHNERHECETLFVGTSAGIILYLNIRRADLQAAATADWKPQIASLRHGHSGHVKLLQLIQMDTADDKPDGGGQQQQVDRAANNLYLISGGTGLDIYGPIGGGGGNFAGDQQQQQQQNSFISQQQLNADEDSLNHLLIWQL